jgi:hypothetical protein
VNLSESHAFHKKEDKEWGDQTAAVEGAEMAEKLFKEGDPEPRPEEAEVAEAEDAQAHVL